MMVGDKDSFAVEFELDQQYGGPWLFGKFCYWIAGGRVGDYELGTSLRDVLLQMRWIVADCGHRAGEGLCTVPPENAFALLDHLLYEDEAGGVEPESQEPDAAAKFDIKIPVDVFDQWKIYLIECDNVARMFFRNAKEAIIRQQTLPIGRFDAVIKEAFDCLNAFYDRESANHGTE